MSLRYLVVFSFLTSSFLYGSEKLTEMTMANQIKYLMTALKYNYTFKENLNGMLTIGVVYNQTTVSKQYKDDFIEKFNLYFEGKTFLGNEITIKTISELRELKNGGLDVVLLAEGLAKDVEKILEITKGLKAISVTGIPEYTLLGVTLSVAQDHHKPVITINTYTARSENVNFSTKLLKNANVIR